MYKIPSLSWRSLIIATTAILAPYSAFGQWSNPDTFGRTSYMNGNVGIGIATPATPLHVTSSTGVPTALRLTGASNWAGVQFENTTLTNGVRWALYNGTQGIASDAISFYNYALWRDALTIASSGNVGIGITNPINVFQVHGATNQNLGIRYDGTAIGLGAYNDAGSASVPMDFNATSFAFQGGNVGIGTTNPHNLLSVNGTIEAKQVTVTNAAADWSDYVFQPGYRLMPLNEVGAFIQAHGHLPGIPSEAEVKESGVDLGAMQAKLLAKVEEITLQMIQAGEQNRALQERIARLEAGAQQPKQ